MAKKTLNILQIINEPWTSGITEYGLILSKGLKKRGHNVIIAGLKNTPVEKGAREIAVDYVLLNNINSLSPFNILNSIKQIKDILVRMNIDVINTHRAEGQALGFLANELAGGKAVLIRTRGDQRPAGNNFLNRYLYRDLTDKIIVASLMAKENHFEGFNITEKVSVVSSAVDTDMFNPEVSGEKFRLKYNIKKDEILIAIIGRLDPVKGHYYFLEAASFLKDVLPLVKYVVIGPEANIKLEQLKNPVKSFGLQERVIFTGFCDNIAEAIAGIDIGVIASIGSEAISRICLEMMACGKPVVASRVGSIPEVIRDNETGLLYNPKDSKALSEHMKTLALNPDFMKKIGHSAYLSVINEFSIENLVKNTEEIYINALDEKWKKSQ